MNEFKWFRFVINWVMILWPWSWQPDKGVKHQASRPVDFSFCERSRRR